MAPKQQTLGYVKPSQTTLGCVENIFPLIFCIVHGLIGVVGGFRGVGLLMVGLDL